VSFSPAGQRYASSSAENLFGLLGYLGELRPIRTAIRHGKVGKILLAETASAFAPDVKGCRRHDASSDRDARGDRLWQRHRNPGFGAGDDLLAVVVATVGNRIEFFDVFDSSM
jgi:hypothetical protein